VVERAGEAGALTLVVVVEVVEMRQRAPKGSPYCRARAPGAGTPKGHYAHTHGRAAPKKQGPGAGTAGTRAAGKRSTGTGQQSREGSKHTDGH
jgi:hypothetical protein